MKVTIDYTCVHSKGLTKAPTGTGARLITEQEGRRESPADVPQHHLEFYVPDETDGARTICEVLGLTIPTASKGS